MPPGAKGRPRFPRIVTKTDEMVAEVPKPQFKRDGPTSCKSCIVRKLYTELDRAVTLTLFDLSRLVKPAILASARPG